MQTYIVIPMCPMCGSDMAGVPNNGIEQGAKGTVFRARCPFCTYTTPWRDTEQKARDDVTARYPEGAR